MVAKIAPEDEVQRTAMNTEIMFSNEHVMYTAVLPKFTELEIAAGVPEKKKLETLNVMVPLQKFRMK